MYKPPHWLRLLHIYGTYFPIARGKGRLTKWMYKKLPREQRSVDMVIAKSINIELYPKRWAEFCTFAIGCPEIYSLAYFQSVIQTDATVFDIGAYIGVYAFTASQIAQAGHVHAFEPHPESAQRIRKIIARNNLTNIYLNECAIGEKTGKHEFGLHRNPTQSTLLGKPSNVEFVNVAVQNIDDYCQNKKIRSISVMKIDVEGAELLVLRGARKSIVKSHPQLLIELHKQQSNDFGYSVEDTIAYLHELGYSLFYLAHGMTVRPRLIPWEQINPNWQRHIVVAR